MKNVTRFNFVSVVSRRANFLMDSASNPARADFVVTLFRSSRSVGHGQDEHQRDPLPESAHQPAGVVPPDVPPLRRLGQPERVAAGARLRPTLRLLRIRVPPRGRGDALLEGRVQV